MLLKKHLVAFNIYIFLLIITLSILINGIPKFPFINFIIYLFVHLLLIYICIYHFKTILYFIFFSVGIVLDLFLLNELGPHIITFMLLILLLTQTKKYIIQFSSKNIFFLIVILLLLSLISEMFISLILFNYSFNISYLIKSIYTSLLI